MNGWPGKVVLGCLLSIALFLGCESSESSESSPPAPATTSVPAAEPISETSEASVPVPEPKPVERAPQPVVDKPQPVATPSGFGPAHVEILPLTELIAAPDGQGTVLNVYVSLLDVYSEKIKAPGTLRFELYEYVQRSAEPKGQRVAIWPDINLTSPTENQRYWRDFLRAYEFSLVTEASRNKTYILEATCLSLGGRRLSAEWPLKPAD